VVRVRVRVRVVVRVRVKVRVRVSRSQRITDLCIACVSWLRCVVTVPASA
jgi:hypothetical protein